MSQPNRPAASREEVMRHRPLPDWAQQPTVGREPAPDRRPVEMSEEDVQRALVEIRAKNNGSPRMDATVTYHGHIENGRQLLERQRRLAMEAQHRT